MAGVVLWSLLTATPAQADLIRVSFRSRTNAETLLTNSVRAIPISGNILATGGVIPVGAPMPRIDFLPNGTTNIYFAPGFYSLTNSILGSGIVIRSYTDDDETVVDITNRLWSGWNTFAVVGDITINEGGGDNSLFATNLGGAVFLVRNGVQTKYQTLEAAGAASEAFDTVIGTGSLNVSNAIRVKGNVTFDLTGATITNWVTQVGTNGPAFVLSGLNPKITGGTYWAAYRNIGSNDSTGFSYQAHFGVLESGLGSSRLGIGGATNFIVEGVTAYGETDVAFFRATNGAFCSGIFRDSTFNTRWDALLVAEGNHKVSLQNVNILAIGTNQASGQQARSYSATFDDATGAEVIWNNCFLTVSNSLGLILNSELGDGCTNRFIGCSFTNLYAAATEDFIIDGGDGDFVFFNNCHGVRPDFVSDNFAGGAGIIYQKSVSGGVVFGGDLLNGASASIGVGATATVLPFTGILDGNGSQLDGDDEAYNESGWDSDTTFPTKNAVRDKFESLLGGQNNWSGSNYFSGNVRFDAMLRATNLTAGGGTSVVNITNPIVRLVTSPFEVRQSDGTLVFKANYNDATVYGANFYGDGTFITNVNAATATIAAGSDSTSFLTFTDAATGAQALRSDAGATYDPTTDTMTIGNLTVSSSFTASGGLVLPSAAGVSTLSTAGQVALNTTDKQVGIHNGTKEVAIPLVHHIVKSFDPDAVCDLAVDRLFVMTVGPDAPKGITITRWNVSFEANPTTEVDLDLKRADAFIGVANSAVMDVLDTTDGVSSETTAANINSGAVVANGKVIYLEFGTAYTETTHQIIFEMWYEIEED